MDANSNFLDGMNSWRSYVNAIEREKKTLPWDSSKGKPIVHVDAHEVNIVYNYYVLIVNFIIF